jgi:hypothetical protein
MSEKYKLNMYLKRNLTYSVLGWSLITHLLLYSSWASSRIFPMKTNYNYKYTEFQNTKYSSSKWWEFVETMENHNLKEQ